MNDSLPELVAERHIIVCCGTGGVGKTTVAATIAIAAARGGRHVLVMTVDPSKRLADSLGLDREHAEPHEIPRASWDPNGDAAARGRLDGLVLDTAATFDGLVDRYSADEAQRDRILENRFYRNLAGALSGTLEYMAMEQLHAQHESGAYELIVVDTPPTRHALDFLDAPVRLIRLLDNRVFRVLTNPARWSWRIAGAALHGFVRRVGTVVGTDLVDDVVAFFRAFEGMEDGFRARATAVRALTADSATAYVLVTTPDPAAIDDAAFFAARLGERDLRVSALVVNRVHPAFTQVGARVSTAETRQRAEALRVERTNDALDAAAHLDLLATYADLSERERTQLRRISQSLGVASIATVERLPFDIHDFATLAEVRHRLFGPTG